MEFDALTMERRSVRSYQSDKTVTPEQIETLLKAVQLAPTWKNTQTGRYHVILDDAKKEALRGCLPAFNQNSSKNASALIVTSYVKNVSGHTNGQADNELGNGWGIYDLGLQNAYLVLKAKDMGLDTLIMGIRDAEAIRALLAIPEDQDVVSVIALGYRDGDVIFKPRKDLNEIATVE